MKMERERRAALVPTLMGPVTARASVFPADKWGHSRTHPLGTRCCADTQLVLNGTDCYSHHSWNKELGMTGHFGGAWKFQDSKRT